MEKTIYIENKHGRVVDVPQSVGEEMIKTGRAKKSSLYQFLKQETWIAGSLSLKERERIDAVNKAAREVIKIGERKVKVKRVVVSE